MLMMQTKLNIIFEKLAQLENNFSSSPQEASPSKSGKPLTSSSFKGPLKHYSSLSAGLSTSNIPREEDVGKNVRPLTFSSFKGPLKIDSSFFPGLNISNSSDKRVEQHEEPVRHDSSTSYTKDVHFEPLIPLPEQVEVQTGEEDEEVMFSGRAKLYRYDKDVSAWKERGIGTLKILYNSEKGRSRILMRREAVHKICANHFITDDMKLTEKKGTTNAWIWNTFADYSEEFSKPEQLAVRFKTQDEFQLFKEKFEQCQKIPKKDTSKVQGMTQSTNEKISNFMAKFAPKPGSWSCSVCLVSNEERTSVCIACGAPKLSGGNENAPTEAPKPGVHFSSQATASSSSATVFSGLQGETSSESQYTLGKVNTGTPFTLAKSATGTLNAPSSSSPFTFALGKDGDKTESPFTFEKSSAETLNTASNSSPFTFSLGKDDAGMVKTSSSSSPFTFGTSPSGAAADKLSGSDKGAVPQSQVFGLSSEVSSTTQPPISLTSVLAAFGVPAIADKSNTLTFTFGSSSMAGASPFSLPTTQEATSENIAAAGNNFVFGGGTPEQAAPGMSFGSFNTGKSPSFDPDLSNHSTSGTQADPLLCEKCEGDSLVAQHVSQQNTQSQSHSSFSFGTPTHNQGISEQKLFWQQPTGTFQFGQLQALPPLGGGNLWHQGTAPLTASATSQPQSSPQTSEMFPQPFTLPPHSQIQGAFTLRSRPEIDFTSSELLRLLAAAKEQQDSFNQDSQAGGYDFTPYVVDEPGEEAYLRGITMPISTVMAEEYHDYGDDDDNEDIGGSQDSEDERLSYTSTEEEDDEVEKPPSRMPAMQSSQTQSQFPSGKVSVVTTPVKPVPIHSTPVDNGGPASLPSHMTGRRFFTAKSPLKATKKQDEDCVLVYEVCTSMGDREKAARLCLPVNFFNYTKQTPCGGCYGCCGIPKETVKSNNEEDKVNTIVPQSVESDSTPKASVATTHVFGESSLLGQLTFSSLMPKEGDAFSATQKKDSNKSFQGAGTQLFTETSEEVEGQDGDKLHFEPVIPLPDEIQVVTGEEGLEVVFCERAKLYRFDADSGQWKERGVGEMKLLRHPKSGQGRVLMRREQIKKLCANHNIDAGLELKPNVGSDRSWVWYTPADYAEGEAKAEKLAIKLKSAEIAGKFKEVFDDLKDTLPSETGPEKEAAGDEQGSGCPLYKQFIATFAPAPGSWTCEVCDVQNNAEHLKCVACDSVKTATEPLGTSFKAREEDLKPSAPKSNASVVESVEANTFQDLNKGSTSTFSIFQSPRAKGLISSNLFTIGRGDPNDDKEDELYLSPSNTSSPSKQGITSPQKPSTPPSKGSLSTSLLFGTNTPVKFTFSMTVSPGSPSRKPKSPLSPASPSSPESPGQADDDGPYFEPLIPLPDKVECRTGEEGQEVLFCERCKLFRYDRDTSQWKERGVGDMKILRNPSANKCRILMRREHVLKLCANHMICADMVLKPFPKSDRAWLWTTLADFSEDVATAETLAARFRTSEVAVQFKETFEKAVQSPVSKAEKAPFSSKPSSWTCEVCDVQNNAGHLKCVACDSVKTATEPLGTSFKGTEEDLKPPAPKSNASVVESVEANTFQDLNKESTSTVSIFQSPRVKGLISSNLFTIGRGDPNDDKEDEIYLSPSKTSSPSKQGITSPQKPSTPPSTSSLSTSLLFGTNTPVKFTFSMTVSPGSPSRKPKSPLSPASPSSPESPGQRDDDGPYFEPLIPLPDKVECRTGEEGQEVLFCERCKLFRYDRDTSQWKERGVGDMKILRNPSANKCRILMRREHVLKLCANHMICADMGLKPFPKSDRAWLWTTLADFSEDVATAETLAARFRTSEVAVQFKETFEKAVQSPVSKAEKAPSSSKPESKHPDPKTQNKHEDDVGIVFEKGVTTDQKEGAKRLELPNNLFRYEDSSPETSSDQSETVARWVILCQCR